MAKSISPKQQRIQFYEYILLFIVAYIILSTANDHFNLTGEIPYIKKEFIAKLNSFLSLPISYFITSYLLIYIPYYSDQKYNDKKHSKKDADNFSKAYRWIFILFHVALIGFTFIAHYWFSGYIIISIYGALIILWHLNYGLFIHSLKCEIPSLSSFWNFLINSNKDSEKVDGYDSLKERVKRCNSPIIGDAEEKDFKFVHRISETKSTIYNSNPRRANIVRGIAGSGKTFSVLNPMGIQSIESDIPTFNYDFKFPEQTKVMLAAYLKHHKKPGYKSKMAINILDSNYLHNSWRISPVNSQSLMTDLHADVYMETFFTTMDKKWIANPDFWAQSTFAYTSAVALAHKRYFGKEFSLAHVLLFLTRNYKEQVFALSNLGDQQLDAKIENIRRPVVEETGGDQLSGIFSTMQNFISKMNNPNVFFNISGSDISMDLNDPNNPYHLCMGNTNFFSKVFSPIISLYSKLSFTMCNAPGKLNFHYLCDEAATIFLDGIDQFINTGRANGMIASIGLQTDAQIDYSYGRELGRLLKSSIGNQYSGQVKDEETQRLISNSMGTYKTTQKNKSEGQNGKPTFNESTIVEKFIRAEELVGLDKGFMLGSVTEGEHKRFMGQFDVSEYYPLYNKAKSLILPLSPTVNKLVKQGEIPKDTVMKYYQGDQNASVKINKKINQYAQSEYDRIVRESNEFFNSLN